MNLTEFKTLTKVVQGRRDDSDDEEAPSGSTPVVSSTPAGISGPDAPASESDPLCSVPSAAATEVHKPRHKVGTTLHIFLCYTVLTCRMRAANGWSQGQYRELG
jgi:hypothetical protein